MILIREHSDYKVSTFILCWSASTQLTKCCAFDKIGMTSVVDPDPQQIERFDPDPHQSDKLGTDPHQFADDRPKCMEYELI